MTEEAMLYVKDLDMFLEDTPPVLSVGKPCEETGYSHELKEGQTHFQDMATLYLANATTSCLSSFLVYQVMEPCQVQQMKTLQSSQRG